MLHPHKAPNSAANFRQFLRPRSVGLNHHNFYHVFLLSKIRRFTPNIQRTQRQKIFMVFTYLPPLKKVKKRGDWGKFSVMMPMVFCGFGVSFLNRTGKDSYLIFSAIVVKNCGNIADEQPSHWRDLDFLGIHLHQSILFQGL